MISDNVIIIIVEIKITTKRRGAIILIPIIYGVSLPVDIVIVGTGVCSV